MRISDVKPTQPSLDPTPSYPGTRNAPRAAPAPIGGSVRPIGGSVRDASAKPVVPNARDLYDRGNYDRGGRTSTTGGTKNPPIDRRYAPTKPMAPADVTPKTIDKPRQAPRSKTPTVTDRYPTRTKTPPPAVSSAPTPRVAPNAAAPRLQPRSIAPSITGRRTSTSSGYCRTIYDNSWNSWWDPCGHYSSHCDSSWSLHGGYGCFGFGVSFWYPWHHYHQHCWSSSYSNCYWNSWSDPYCPSSNYWWYPSTTYCPTYFYVPSSVVYIESEPASSAGTEVLVAGGPVRGSAEVRDIPHGAAERNLPPDDLAKKYIELGDFYFKAGRFAEAAETYARARTYAPDDASVHFVLADAAFATGDYHFAAFLIAEALRLDPALASADTDKRLFYGDPKVFEEQMAALDKYLTEKPYDASAHLVRGYNLRFSGRPTAAIAAFRRVLEIAPEQPVARTFLAALAPADAAEPTIR